MPEPSVTREDVARELYISHCAEQDEHRQLAADAWERLRSNLSYPFVRQTWRQADAVMALYAARLATLERERDEMLWVIKKLSVHGRDHLEAIQRARLLLEREREALIERAIRLVGDVAAMPISDEQIRAALTPAAPTGGAAS